MSLLDLSPLVLEKSGHEAAAELAASHLIGCCKCCKQLKANIWVAIHYSVPFQVKFNGIEEAKHVDTKI